jgi:hypothetical protein
MKKNKETNIMNDINAAMPPRVFDPAAIDALRKETLSLKRDAAMERLAVLFVVYCFRDTVLEDYHSQWPQFTDEKMKELMKQAVNRMHTALHAFFTGDKETQDAVWEVLNGHYPAGWDTPEFDQGMLRLIELTKRAQKQDAKAAKKANSTKK